MSESLQTKSKFPREFWRRRKKTVLQLINEREGQGGHSGTVAETPTAEEGRLGRSINPAFKSSLLAAHGAQLTGNQKTRATKITNGNAII